jgi:hypothetical protein
MFSPNTHSSNSLGNSVVQHIKSQQNLAYISAQIYALAKQYHGIELDERFKGIMLGTVDNTLKQFGTKTVKISDKQHLDNLNKIIVDDCLKYVQQYKSTMGNVTNPFTELNDHKLDSNNLSKAVDDLAAARGYQFQSKPNEGVVTPRLEFTEPMQDRHLNSDELARKLEMEKGLFNTSNKTDRSSLQLHELLGTPKPDNDGFSGRNVPLPPPNMTQSRPALRSDLWSPHANPSASLPAEDSHQTNDNKDISASSGTTSVQDEYTRRVNMIKQRDNNSSLLPVELPRGKPSIHRDYDNVTNANRDLASNENTQSDTQQYQQQQQQHPLQQQQHEQQPSEYEQSDSFPRISKQVSQNSTRKSINLCLDLRQSCDCRTLENTYILRFNRIETLIGLQLNSFMCPNYKNLANEPSLGLQISNLPSRYGNVNLFSKMNLSNSINNYGLYKPGEIDCWVPDTSYISGKSSDISNLDYLEISLRTWDDKAINLEILDVEQILKNSKSGTMKVICREPHFLQLGDPVSFAVTDVNSRRITAERIEVLRINDDTTFVTTLPEMRQGDIQLSRIYPRITLNFTVYYHN